MSINAQSSLTDLQNNTNLVNFQNGRNNLGSGKLDRQGFMQLILAQLQYQDPTNPQDNSQMLAQQLQLEQADQMKDMVNTTKFSQASSMIGKQATLFDAPWDFNNNVSSQTAIDATTGQPAVITGTIESVQFDQAHGKALVKINGNYYDADNIKGLTMPTTTTTNGTTTTGGSTTGSSTTTDTSTDSSSTSSGGTTTTNS